MITGPEVLCAPLLHISGNKTPGALLHEPGVTQKGWGAMYNDGFYFTLAEEKDIEELAVIMNEAASDREHPEWFVSDNADYIRDHLEGKGFVATARTGEGRIAGFFIIKFGREAADELGELLDFTDEQKEKTAVMDSAVVRKQYRGHGLQGRMLSYCESLLKGRELRYYLCTVHPDNRFSLANMQNGGFEIIKRVYCYGGCERFLLMKKGCL